MGAECRSVSGSTLLCGLLHSHQPRSQCPGALSSATTGRMWLPDGLAGQLEDPRGGQVPYHTGSSQLPLPRNQSQGSRKHGKEKPASKVKMGRAGGRQRKGGRGPQPETAHSTRHPSRQAG